MAKVVWNGEEGDPTEYNEWRGIKFKKGEAVEVTDEVILAKASKNPHFKVSGYTPKVAPKDETKGPPTFAPPSNTVSPQHPVPKAGEPVFPEEAAAAPPPEAVPPPHEVTPHKPNVGIVGQAPKPKGKI